MARKETITSDIIRSNWPIILHITKYNTSMTNSFSIEFCLTNSRIYWFLAHAETKSFTQADWNNL